MGVGADEPNETGAWVGVGAVEPDVAWASPTNCAWVGAGETGAWENPNWVGAVEPETGVLFDWLGTKD